MDEFNRALRTIAEVMRDGASKHPTNDWLNLPFEYLASRAAEHLRRLAEGDQSQDHLIICHARQDVGLQATTRRVQQKAVFQRDETDLARG